MKDEIKYTEKEVEELLSAQRSNCWVALSRLTKQYDLLKVILNSPEPGHWREKVLYRTPKLEELSYGDKVEVFNPPTSDIDTWIEMQLGFGILGNFENLQKLILDKQIRIKI